MASNNPDHEMSDGAAAQGSGSTPNNAGSTNTGSAQGSAHAGSANIVITNTSGTNTGSANIVISQLDNADHLIRGQVQGWQALSEVTNLIAPMIGSNRAHFIVSFVDGPEQQTEQVSRNSPCAIDPPKLSGPLHRLSDPLNRRHDNATYEERLSVCCGNCQRPGHVIAQCVTNWSDSGDIPGCYRCNRLDHIIDDCKAMPPYTDFSRYYFEITLRVGRPPLRSRRGWNELVNRYGLRHGTDGHGNAYGPCSRQVILVVHSNHFDDWDYEAMPNEQRHLLVLDPATATADAIRLLPDQGYELPELPDTGASLASIQ
ncbi:hypothetical protein GGR52DRAFT_587181 [Hypoxylon sp. FL1284]|nr:hypothetical protein GGR52DRAFT_587181 [Hypoxylon sp. FL1284]